MPTAVLTSSVWQSVRYKRGGRGDLERRRGRVQGLGGGGGSAVDFNENFTIHHSLRFNRYTNSSIREAVKTISGSIAKIPTVSCKGYTILLRSQQPGASTADLYRNKRNFLFPGNASAAVRHCSSSRYRNTVAGIQRPSVT